MLCKSVKLYKLLHISWKYPCFQPDLQITKIIRSPLVILMSVRLRTIVNNKVQCLKATISSTLTYLLSFPMQTALSAVSVVLKRIQTLKPLMNLDPNLVTLKLIEDITSFDKGCPWLSVRVV